MKKTIIFLFLLLFPGFFFQSNTASAQERKVEYLTVPVNFSCWLKDDVFLQARSPEGIIITYRPAMVNCNNGTVSFIVDEKHVDWELKIVVE